MFYFAEVYFYDDFQLATLNDTDISLCSQQQHHRKVDRNKS